MPGGPPRCLWFARSSITALTAPASDQLAPIVVIGGGFAGLSTALAFRHVQPRPPVVLIEPRERFVFVPLLYELLSGELGLGGGTHLCILVARPWHQSFAGSRPIRRPEGANAENGISADPDLQPAGDCHRHSTGGFRHPRRARARTAFPHPVGSRSSASVPAAGSAAAFRQQHSGDRRGRCRWR